MLNSPQSTKEPTQRKLGALARQDVISAFIQNTDTIQDRLLIQSSLCTSSRTVEVRAAIRSFTQQWDGIKSGAPEESIEDSAPVSPVSNRFHSRPWHKDSISTQGSCEPESGSQAGLPGGGKGGQPGNVGIVDDAGNSLEHPHKSAIIDYVMRDFWAIFSQQVETTGYTRHGNGNSGTTTLVSNSGETPGESSSGSRGNTSLSNGKKRRASSRNDAGRDNDEDDGELDDNHLPDTPRGEARRRFACPYLRRWPEKFKSERACVTPPGFLSVHRVKEHLYRKHARPIHCSRCMTKFNDVIKLKNHVRSRDPCELNGDTPEWVTYTFDVCQGNRLRSRKKATNALTEEEKWKRVYMILFPGINAENIPDPYYEDIVAARDACYASNEFFAQYEAFLRAALPDAVHEELNRRLDQTLFPVEDGMRTQLVEIVRDMQVRLFREFRNSTADNRSTTMAPEHNSGSGNREQPSHANSHDSSSRSNIMSYQSTDMENTWVPTEGELQFDTGVGFDGVIYDYSEYLVDSGVVDYSK